MRGKLFDLCVMTACIALLGYFAWHGVYGSRSIDNKNHVLARAELHQEQLDDIKAKRIALETRVNLMRPDSIDPDLLDELARSALGYVLPNDLTVTRQ